MTLALTASLFVEKKIDGINFTANFVKHFSKHMEMQCISHCEYNDRHSPATLLAAWQYKLGRSKAAAGRLIGAILFYK